MTKLASSLPSGEANGLASLARKLIDNPAEVHVVIALVDCKSVTTDVDSGDITPTARIRRIEPITGDRDLVAKVMRRAMEERTGKTVLPFSLEEDLRTAFGAIDPETGEVSG